MDMLVSLPEPEDMEREPTTLTSLSLKEEIRLLRDKYGQPSAALLDEVERVISKYEGSIQANPQKIDQSLVNLDQETVTRAQHIVRSFLQRKKFATLASQFLTSPLAKELGKRNEIWREILHTERSYFQSLVLLYETFFKPLKMKSMASSTQDHKILTEKQIFKIFQNIEDVKNSAKNMWKKLEETCKNWPETSPRIGQVFVSLMQEIRSFYSPYIKGLQKAMTNLAKTRKNSAQFSEFLDRTSSDFSGSEPSLPLHSLLMLPQHRLSQYETYLRELTILTPSDHVDHEDLVRANREISALNAELSVAKSEAFKAQKLYHINATLKGVAVPNILAGKVEGTRIFVREGPVLTIGERKNKRSYIYLFTDSLVLADINEANEEKAFDFMLPLSGAEIKEVHEPPAGVLFVHGSSFSGSISQHLFAIIKENKKLVLGTSTLSERASWMNDISTVINELSSMSSKRTNRTFSPKLSLAKSTGSSLGMISPRGEAHADLVSASPRGRSGTVQLGGSFTANMVTSESFMKSLSRQYVNKSIDSFIEVIPSRVKLSKLVPKECLLKFRGPVDDESESDKYTGFASAKVTSTYPFDKERNVRLCDPIADHCGLAAWGNRILGLVADGCHRGFRAQQAASRAVDTFISDFVELKTNPQDLRELAVEMMRSLGHVHENIIAGIPVVWEAGTTTLLASILVEVEPSPITSQQKWALLTVSVGDCKAFIWSKSNKSLREVTNHLSPNDLRDPGGRLGPYIYQGCPDLRDLSVSCAFCSDEDLIILCSDGVYDNFDPELSGVNPKELANLLNSASKYDIKQEQLKQRWDQMEMNVASELKSLYRTRTLEQLLELDTTFNPRNITRAIVNHCVRQTRASREYLEQNSEQKLPNDHNLFPGAMDHLSCLVFQVGTVQL